ncbi:lysophospholipid acyltransferase family protein [Oceanomicrobium pacificus]|uniref:1-acyl-sn-glycerol-3-phosphate acyltransferase n=1 Tax=Oceanomicrobium pacificus TaxID=2692916 RepID=A0A6B0TS02_9RHOB|nr:1-acyl-sn-glycerol-3-phosphate acyltransferase [Oceanomicrobium pacificus]MXU63982.1 1-acyl-sn-glycerol-3-phosphate acyltransferase [Oceanomicrobium pacificus]
MLLIRSQFVNLLMYVLMAVMGILLSPAAIWSRDGAYWACKLYCKIMFWLLDKICGLKIEIRGEVPSDEVIVCSKHQSFLDIMMLMHALPRARYIMKAQLKWAPVIGWYGMRIGSAPVSRGKRGAAMKQMVENAEKSQATDPGQTIIFPQGTRVLPGAKLPYKVGAGVLYQRLGQDCVPAATNVGVFWARRSPYRYPGTAVLEFLPRIPAGKKIEPFMAELEEVVETRSNALMEEAGFTLPPEEPAADIDDAGKTRA